mmetsp:Transcript_30689/g.66345  ORF Transcript_30689/g.66345 Transcript_30689/m.66345 type:complete len:258 (-) Transcript_30689:743-1516(-)
MSNPARRLPIPPSLCRVIMRVLPRRCCRASPPFGIPLVPLLTMPPPTLWSAAICAISSAMSFTAMVLLRRCRSPVVLVGSFAASGTGTGFESPLALDGAIGPPPSLAAARLEPSFGTERLEMLLDVFWLAFPFFVDGSGCRGGRAAAAAPPPPAVEATSPPNAPRGFNLTPSSGSVPSIRPAASYSSVHAESSKMFSPDLRVLFGGLGLASNPTAVKAETSLRWVRESDITCATGTPPSALSEPPSSSSSSSSRDAA